MKIVREIRKIRQGVETQLTDAGYYCLYGMHSHGDHTSYVNEVFNAIDAMTHEIQFRVNINVSSPVFGVLIGFRL